MTPTLPYAEIEFRKNNIGNYNATADGVENGSFLEVHLEYPEDIKQKQVFFPFCPESEKVDVSSVMGYMKSNNSRNYKPSKNYS